MNYFQMIQQLNLWIHSQARLVLHLQLHCQARLLLRLHQRGQLKIRTSQSVQGKKCSLASKLIGLFKSHIEEQDTERIEKEQKTFRQSALKV